MSEPEAIRLGESALEWLRDRTSFVALPSIVFGMEGPGATECLQGILTNDVARPGPGHLIYGALLTPKGMIVVDLWVFRTRRGFLVVCPAEARDLARDYFKKRLPPRLVTVTELTEWTAGWAIGAGVEATVGKLGFPYPQLPGTAVSLGGTAESPLLGVPVREAPGTGLIVAPDAWMEEFQERWQDAGALIAGGDHLEAVRVLAGWPRLGVEIGEKTLPQEVRLDELGGVSHTKGCYVGQETVARIHFRGHPNRILRGLLWSGPAFPPGTAALVGEKVVGTMSSCLLVEDRRVGLALIRREVAVEEEVMLGDDMVPARVAMPPFWEFALGK